MSGGAANPDGDGVDLATGLDDPFRHFKEGLRKWRDTEQTRCAKRLRRLTLNRRTLATCELAAKDCLKSYFPDRPVQGKAVVALQSAAKEQRQELHQLLELVRGHVKHFGSLPEDLKLPDAGEATCRVRGGDVVAVLAQLLDVASGQLTKAKAKRGEAKKDEAPKDGKGARDRDGRERDDRGGSDRARDRDRDDDTRRRGDEPQKDRGRDRGRSEDRTGDRGAGGGRGDRERDRDRDGRDKGCRSRSRRGGGSRGRGGDRDSRGSDERDSDRGGRDRGGDRDRGAGRGERTDRDRRDRERDDRDRDRDRDRGRDQDRDDRKDKARDAPTPRR